MITCRSWRIQDADCDGLSLACCPNLRRISLSWYTYHYHPPPSCQFVEKCLSPPSPAPRFPKYRWVLSGVSMTPGILAPSCGRGIPWIPCTTSLGNIGRDTKGTRCWSITKTKIFVTPTVFCGGIGKGGFYDSRED